MKIMTKKEKFIELVETGFKAISIDINDPDTADAMAYWEAFKGKKEIEKPEFTDNGKLILKYLQDHATDIPMAKAKDIGEGLFVSSRVVSGAIRKLVTDGYVEKIGQDPVVYAITNKGKEVKFED
jgi:DNA-binding MarR family transcriptional regulator